MTLFLFEYLTQFFLCTVDYFYGFDRKGLFGCFRLIGLTHCKVSHEYGDGQITEYPKFSLTVSVVNISNEDS